MCFLNTSTAAAAQTSTGDSDRQSMAVPSPTWHEHSGVEAPGRVDLGHRHARGIRHALQARVDEAGLGSRQLGMRARVHVHQMAE